MHTSHRMGRIGKFIILAALPVFAGHEAGVARGYHEADSCLAQTGEGRGEEALGCLMRQRAAGLPEDQFLFYLAETYLAKGSPDTAHAFHLAGKGRAAPEMQGRWQDQHRRISAALETAPRETTPEATAGNARRSGLIVAGEAAGGFYQDAESDRTWYPFAPATAPAGGDRGPGGRLKASPQWKWERDGGRNFAAGADLRLWRRYDEREGRLDLGAFVRAENLAGQRIFSEISLRWDEAPGGSRNFIPGVMTGWTLPHGEAVHTLSTGWEGRLGGDPSDRHLFGWGIWHGLLALPAGDASLSLLASGIRKTSLSYAYPVRVVQVNDATHPVPTFYADATDTVPLFTPQRLQPSGPLLDTLRHHLGWIAGPSLPSSFLHAGLTAAFSFRRLGRLVPEGSLEGGVDWYPEPYRWVSGEVPWDSLGWYDSSSASVWVARSRRDGKYYPVRNYATGSGGVLTQTVATVPLRWHDEVRLDWSGKASLGASLLLGRAGRMTANIFAEVKFSSLSGRPPLLLRENEIGASLSWTGTLLFPAGK